MQLIQDELIETLVKILEKGAISRDLIEVTEYQRGIGKTTALIKFAKKYGFGVIVFSRGIARMLREFHGYENIFAITDVTSLRGSKVKNVVIDEGVDKGTVKDFGLTVVTGFKTRKI